MTSSSIFHLKFIFLKKQKERKKIANFFELWCLGSTLCPSWLLYIFSQKIRNEVRSSIFFVEKKKFLKKEGAGGP
jgi:hypothetical protein